MMVSVQTLKAPATWPDAHFFVFQECRRSTSTAVSAPASLKGEDAVMLGSEGAPVDKSVDIGMAAWALRSAAGGVG